MNLIGNWRMRKPSQDAETVYISEKFGVRSLHIGSDTVQSAMRIAAPADLELAYTRSMMGCLLFGAEPASVLMIGLGGGSVAKFIYHRMPGVKIRAIELREVRADLIMVDGYDGESLAEALSTTAFYRDCHDRLSKNGMLVVNLWGGDREFHDTLKRIEAAFPAGTLCLPAEKPGNIIVFGFRDAPGKQPWATLRARAAVLETRFELPFVRFVEALNRMNRHDETALFIGGDL